MTNKEKLFRSAIVDLVFLEGEGAGVFLVSDRSIRSRPLAEKHQYCRLKMTSQMCTFISAYRVGKLRIITEPLHFHLM